MAEPPRRGLRAARRSGLTSPGTGPHPRRPSRPPSTPPQARNPDKPHNRRAAGSPRPDSPGKLPVQKSTRKRSTGIGRWIEAKSDRCGWPVQRCRRFFYRSRSQSRARPRRVGAPHRRPLSSDLARQTHWHLSGWTEQTVDQLPVVDRRSSNVSFSPACLLAQLTPKMVITVLPSWSCHPRARTGRKPRTSGSSQTTRKPALTRIAAVDPGTRDDLLSSQSLW